MIEYKTVKTEAKVFNKFICDVCGMELTEDDIMELQETLSINFTGGYGSIFGDCYSFSCDICQYCLKEKLGEYIRIVEEENC